MKKSCLIKTLFILTGVIVISLLAVQVCIVIMVRSAYENPCGLYKLIMQDHTSHAEILISQGMSDKPCGGIFPIHAASEKANQHILKLLLTKGEDPNRLDEGQFKTPIMWLVGGDGLTTEKSVGCFELLVEKGADLNLKSPKTGWSPLHLSVEYEDFITTKGLIERGAEIDAQDKKRKTPLHFAVENNNEKLTELLLDSGASKSLVDNDNETPLDIAKRMKFPDIQKLLTDEVIQDEVKKSQDSKRLKRGLTTEKGSGLGEYNKRAGFEKTRPETLNFRQVSFNILNASIHSPFVRTVPSIS